MTLTLIRSLKVKSTGVMMQESPIYHFLFVSNSNHTSISHHWAAFLAAWKIFMYCLLSLGQNLDPQYSHPFSRVIFFKIE